jgi:hypothetical protein
MTQRDQHQLEHLVLKVSGKVTLAQRVLAEIAIDELIAKGFIGSPGSKCSQYGVKRTRSRSSLRIDRRTADHASSATKSSCSSTARQGRCGPTGSW